MLSSNPDPAEPLPAPEATGVELLESVYTGVQKPPEGESQGRTEEQAVVEAARDFGHDKEIGALFAAYDKLVRWEEHDSRIAAVDPIQERAAARGRIVAFIANTTWNMRGGAG